MLTVLNALNFITMRATVQDCVLVHDAVRPCVSSACSDRLCQRSVEHEVGAILGVPVSDTLKLVDAQKSIQATRDRSDLWQAQTPQMFRYQLLHQCLARALAQGEQLTDEASALEVAGYKPLMVEGRTDNSKVTRPGDLKLAELILQHQQES